MADIEEMTPGQLLADTNIATYIERLGLGIAEAQRALDQNSLETAVALATERPEFSDKSLLQLGFSPTFYHYQYADLEVSLQITMRVDRSTSVRVGLNGSYGYSGSSGSQTTGTAHILVRYGGGSSALAKVRLSQAGPGSIKVGETTVNLQSGEDVAAPNVAIVPNSLRGTANAIAERMRETEPNDSVPEVARATVTLVPGGTPIRATTDASSVFDTGTDNKIRVLSSPARPARAWVTVTGPGTVILRGVSGDPEYTEAPYAASPSAPEAAVTAINGKPGYSAVLLFNERLSLRNPLFAFDKHDVFETPTEREALEEWVEFLNEFPGQTVRIIGHADQSGREADNQRLSQRRADWIKQQLLDLGIAPSRITQTIGRGETQPVEDRGSSPHAPNRRVELELVGPAEGPQNVIRIVTASSGATATWGGGRPGFANPTEGRLLQARDGADAVAAAEATHVKVKDHYLYVRSRPTTPATPNSVWEPGVSAEATATALAAAITTNAGVEAYAEGRVVHLLPEGSHAIIELESAQRSAAANSLTLEVTGPSLHREAGFTGGAESGDPQEGNTITLGTTVLTCRTGTPGVNEFARGSDAASTATNLAQAISGVSGFTASAEGAKVNITGPSGTGLSTNNPGAFQLSAAQLSRPTPEVNRETSNHAVAVGLSLDVGYQRRFGLDATGNSRIATRLVSVPAPVELLDELRTWLDGNPTFPQPSSPGPTPTPNPTPTT